MVRPAIGAHLNRVAAPVIGAIDQAIANAGGAHLAKDDLLRACEKGMALHPADRAPREAARTWPFSA
jgi:hypothetical protein